MLQRYDEWSASIAADLVGRALTPHRFAEIVPGVTVVIGSRRGEGQITDFFADDSRDQSRRTYSARSAVRQHDDGYVLQLRDGAVQYMTDDMRFSEIRFASYDLAIKSLTNQRSVRENVTSIELIQQALATGAWPATTHPQPRRAQRRGPPHHRHVPPDDRDRRLPPSGRRRNFVPLELVVLGFAFLERGVSSALNPAFVLAPMSGSFALLIAAAVIFAVRLKPFGPRLVARPA